uniref:Thiamine biosynthesis protein S n=1 Tax=Sheathia arcuata TaxID=340433 RepID=A0A3G1I8Y1_9FLOR|nr:thiamine biosynthesis protein S [Sheathia arcuata]ART65406.1 thiamine biosynthesis protein S [Sheathia arcuata]
MKNNYITIQINGEPFNCPNNMSIYDLICYFDINSKLVLVEYNKDMIYDNQFIDILLKQNDKLEIITIVGGG